MKTYDLERFVKAQENDYLVALAEIKAGRKKSHWIWYIFPQLEGLGRSDTAKFYGIKNIDEARAYLAHPVLGARLKEISAALLGLGLDQNDPAEVMGGYPDDLKLQSCMTLFAYISEEGSVFHDVLYKFFGGQQDERTLSKLQVHKNTLGNVLAVLFLCAGVLFCSAAEPAHADVWRLGETRRVASGYTADGTNYPLIKGTFRFPSEPLGSSDKTFDRTAVFFYSDGFFAKDPYKYNSHIAAASMCMAMAGFYSNDGGSGRNADYSNKNKNIIQYMKDIGCQNIHNNFYNTVRPQPDSMGVTIGSKNLPSGKILVAVSTRGNNYEREWASNVTLGSGTAHNGESQGFAEAADIVLEEIQNYISSQLSGYSYDDIVFWITGFSRGGTAVNLSAKSLVDICLSKGITSPKIFAYTFEAPQAGLSGAELSGANYNCIHNIINPDDLAPKLVPSYMGFKRYGVDHYMPGTEAGEISNGSDNTFSRTAVDKNIMLQHWKAVNESADSSLLKDQVPAYGLNINSFLISTNQNVYVNDFCDDFVNTLQSWLGLSRNVYNGKPETAVIDGKPAVVSYGDVQQTARDFMKLLHDFPPEESKEFTKRITDWCAGDMLGALDLITNFCNAIGEYHTYDGKKKNKLKNKLVDWISESGCFDALSLTSAEKDIMLNYDLRTLIDILMTYLSQDYLHPMYGVEGLTQFLTLLSAGDTIQLNHYPEITLARLRAVDSFYADETEKVTRAEDSGLVIGAVFSADSSGTEGRVLAGCMPVDYIITDHGTDYISLLPEKTYIWYTNGSFEEAAITWDTANYVRCWYNEDEADIDEYGEFAGWTLLSGDENPHPESAHLYVFAGKVNVPNGVSVSDETDKDLYVSVFAAGLPKMNAPDCRMPDGDYVGSITVSFDCIDDAEIYYSVSGTGIVNEKYTGPFTLDVGGAVSAEYEVTAYTKASGSDRADSRPVIWSYRLRRSEKSVDGEDTESTGSVGSSGGGCEVSYSVCAIGFVLLALMMRRKVHR